MKKNSLIFTKKERNLIFTTVILAVLMTFSSCGTGGGGQALMSADGGTGTGESTTQAVSKKITAEEAEQRIKSGEPLVVLDVRTADEYAEKHIPGAVLLPVEDIGDTRPPLLPVLDTEILIYCRSGNRSAQAAEKLSGMGYTNIYDFGGINDWTYETETGQWEEENGTGKLTSFDTFDLNGVPRDESIFAGKKLTMVNVWATFCGPCLDEMPDLGEIAAAYEDKGLQIVGIVTDVPQNDDGSFDQSQVEEARKLVEETKADYLHLLPSSQLLQGALNGIDGVPTTIFVDEKGNQVGEIYVGSRNGEQWINIIDERLEGSDGE